MANDSRGLTILQGTAVILAVAFACAALQAWMAALVATSALVGCLLVSLRRAPVSDLFVLMLISVLLGGLITVAERARGEPKPPPQRTRPAAVAFTHDGETMTRRFRISRSPDVGDPVDSVEALEAFARSHGPGRYDVDEHSLDLSAGTKVSARAWGKVINHHDGRVVLDPIPWQP